MDVRFQTGLIANPASKMNIALNFEVKNERQVR
jgi:hypothetical protein